MLTPQVYKCSIFQVSWIFFKGLYRKEVILNETFTEDALPDDKRLREEPDKDVRLNQMDEDNMVEAKNEFYDGDQDNDKHDP